jgi:dephospho-CoA kinase
MIVLGLTGSIAMGKSTAAAMFRRLGVPVYDADGAVHRLLGAGGQAVPMIEAAFPGVIQNGAVDRRALGARVFDDAAALATLEGILHPLVARQRQMFLRRADAERRPLIVLDIPLLFETGGERLCDAVAVVSAPACLQYARLRRREGMSRERIDAILRRQMPDAEKRRRADFVIPTGRGKGVTYAVIRQLVSTLLRRRSAKASGSATRTVSMNRIPRRALTSTPFPAGGGGAKRG